MIAHPAEPPSFDLANVVTISVSSVAAPAYDNLTTPDPARSTEIIGQLAKSWDISQDGTVYTFHLNDGIAWHDGRPFTAQDAVNGLEVLANGHNFSRTGLSKIVKMEVVDTKTLALTAAHAWTGLVWAVGTELFLLPPKHAIDAGFDLKNEMLGTGPFKFVEYVRGSRVVFTKNEDYYIQGRPFLDGLNFVIIKDESTRLAALRTGRVDIVDALARMSSNRADELRAGNPDLVIEQMEENCAARIAINSQEPPWDDIRVRQAVNLALDREAAKAVVGEGVGTTVIVPLYGQFALPADEMAALPGYRQPKDQDRAEAKRLLADAGYPDGLDAVYTLRADAVGQPDWAEFVQDQMATVGIRLTIDGMESGQFVQRVYSADPTYGIGGDFGCLLWPHPSGLAAQMNDGSALWGRKDPALLAIYDQLQQAPDTAGAISKAHEFQRLWVDLNPSVFGFGRRPFLAWAPEVRDYVVPAGIFGNLRYQDVWLNR